MSLSKAISTAAAASQGRPARWCGGAVWRREKGPARGGSEAAGLHARRMEAVRPNRGEELAAAAQNGGEWRCPCFSEPRKKKIVGRVVL